MDDHEIKTKRLSDWKPEQDVKIQKVFGKLVEEIGEFQEALCVFMKVQDQHYSTFVYRDAKADLESEMADCHAFIHCSETVAELIQATDEELSQIAERLSDECQGWSDYFRLMIKHAGSSLKILGRCQIQGLSGSDPETMIPNKRSLNQALTLFKTIMLLSAEGLDLNKDRMHRRCVGKVDSKMPWILGTATDLLPST